MKFSSKILKCQLSPVRKFNPCADQAVAAGRTIYHLNIGQPDVKTPESFYQAVREFREPTLEYAPASGLPAYIDAVRGYYAKLGVKLEREDILATSGGGEALEFIMACILDDGDELLGTLTEKEKGEYSMNDLFYGRYFVKETKAPEGFVLDTGVYEVMIDTNGKTYEVENKAGVGFVNDAMRGNLKIVKTSSDGKVKGFAFRITGANGYDIILETNDKGEIFIDELRIGDYTISEVSNSASSMYVLPADKKATVKLGSTTIVEMHNVLRDTPKTGDTTNLPLLYALAGLSAVGIAVCGVIGFKKKKKEDRN